VAAGRTIEFRVIPLIHRAQIENGTYRAPYQRVLWALCAGKAARALDLLSHI